MKRIQKLSVVLGSLFFFPFLAFSQNNCPNLDFSSGTLNLWDAYIGSCASGNYRVNPSAPIPGRHTIMDAQKLLQSGQFLDEMCNKISKVPDGFQFSARIGNSTTGADVDALEYTLTVDSNSSLLILHFAWVMEDPKHPKEQQPQFKMKVTDVNGRVLDVPCANVEFFGGEGNLQGVILACNTGSMQAKNWTTVGFSLESVMGQTIKIYFETWDCTQSGHYGYAYIVGECRPMRIDLMYCAGSSVARMTAPTGFVSYEWKRSSNPGWSADTKQISVQNPGDGETFTCNLKSELGCNSQVKTEIVKTSIDAGFFFGVKDRYGHVPIEAHNYLSWYDTCSRTATFVDKSMTFNSKKDIITWEIHGLSVVSHDSMFTYTFPDPPTNQPVTYLVRLTVQTENGCIDTSKILHYITIYPSAKVKIIGPTELCEGKSIYLTTTTLRSKFTEHHWSGVKKDGTPIPSTIGDSLLITGSGTYYLRSLDTNDCYAYDTLNITPLRPIIQGLQITNVLCWGDQTGGFSHGNITGGSEKGYISAVWTYYYPDGTPQIDLITGDTLKRDITHLIGGTVFYRDLYAGIYTFWAIDVEGCDIMDTVIITQPDSLRLFPTPHKTTCLKPNGKMYFSATGGVTPYTFSVMGPENKTGTSPIETLPKGDYIVRVIDNNKCTTEVADIVIEDTPYPKVLLDTLIGIIDETCGHGNGEIGIMTEDAPAPCIFNWTPNRNSKGELLEGEKYYHIEFLKGDDAGKGKEYKLHFVDANNCTIDTSFFVGAYPMLKVPYTVRPETCGRKDGEITLNVESGESSSVFYEWTGLSVQTNTATDLATGTYTVKISDVFCDTTIDIVVPHVDGPRADFWANTYSVPTNTIFTLTDNTSGTPQTWLWDMGDGNDLTGRIARHSYGDAGEYTVWLVAIDTNGCVDSISKVIYAYEELRVYIPNMFTPDGNGLNDTWRPVLLEYSKEGYQLSIYDRWGQRVFYTTDTEASWDGNIDGKPAQNNTVYSYRLLVRDFTGQEFEFVGHVTIMR